MNTPNDKDNSRVLWGTITVIGSSLYFLACFWDIMGILRSIIQIFTK